MLVLDELLELLELFDDELLAEEVDDDEDDFVEDCETVAKILGYSLKVELSLTLNIFSNFAFV